MQYLTCVYKICLGWIAKNEPKLQCLCSLSTLVTILQFLLQSMHNISGNSHNISLRLCINMHSGFFPCGTSEVLSYPGYRIGLNTNSKKTQYAWTSSLTREEDRILKAAALNCYWISTTKEHSLPLWKLEPLITKIVLLILKVIANPLPDSMIGQEK